MPAKEENALISTTTILILSGFLVGISFDQPLGDLSYYVFNCGLTGLIAYMTFELTGVREDCQHLQQGQLAMEARLARHVSIVGQPAVASSSEKERLLEWLRQETDGLLH